MGADFSDNDIEPRPFLPDFLNEIILSYRRLESSRPIINGIHGTLPMSEIESYIRLFPQPNIKFFIELIQFIDNYVFEFNVKNIKSK